MITVYGIGPSRSTRVVWTLEEIGTDYDYVKVDLMGGGTRRPPFSELNPFGTVPVLKDHDLVLTESGAICLYLCEKFPDAGLLPPVGEPDRARCLKWAFFVTSELEQPLWTKAKHTFALPEDWRVPAVKDTANREFERAVAVLAGDLGDAEYLVGGRFSVADILVGHTLAWAGSAKMPLPDNVAAYAKRVLARPALARARERDAAA